MPPSQDPARRAVVTGLGAVMPNGNDFETYWASLQAGVSGVAPITSFDASGFEVRIAAEVKGFDPGTGMDPKMARRMSRFIHFAMAAGKEAIAHAGLDFGRQTPEQRDRVGRRREHGRRRHRADHRGDAHGRRARPALRQPVRDPGPLGLDGRLHALDGVRPDRAGHGPDGRLRDLDHRLPRRPPPDPVGRGGRGPDGRQRGADPPGGHRGARQHGRPLEAQRRPDAGEPAVRPRSRRVRPRRGRGRRGRGVAGPRPRARARPRSPRSSVER